MFYENCIAIFVLIDYYVQVHLLEDNDDMLEQLGLMENPAANNDAPAPPPPPPLPLPAQPMEQD